MSLVTTTYFPSCPPISQTSRCPLRKLHVFTIFRYSLQSGSCQLYYSGFKTSQVAIGLLAPTAHKILTLIESDVMTSILKTNLFFQFHMLLLSPTHVSFNAPTILLGPKRESLILPLDPPSPHQILLTAGQKKSLQWSFFYLTVRVQNLITLGTACDRLCPLSPTIHPYITTLLKHFHHTGSFS